MKVVYALPATCTVGEAAFLTNSPDGHNLYGCTATNQWILQSGSGLPSGIAGGKLAGSYPYPDLAANRTTATASVITAAAGGCASSIAQSTIHGSATIARISGTDTGLFTIACNSLAALTCYYDSGITIGNYSVTGFAGSTCTSPAPTLNIGVIANVVISNGSFSALPSDLRVDTVVPMTPSAGVGLISILNGLAIDTSVIPQMFFGITAPGSVDGNLPGNWYTDTGAKVLYECQKPAGTAPPACSAVGSGNWTPIPGTPTQTFYANGNGSISAGVVSYLVPIGRFDNQETVIENAQVPTPKAGTIKNLCAFYVGVVSAADQPLTITLNVNGTDDINIVATMAVSSPTGTKFCSAAGQSRVVLASDLITFSAQYTGASGEITSIRNLYWDLQ